MIRRPQWRRVKQGIAWIFSDPGGAARQHRRHCSLKFRHSQEQTVDSEFYQALRTGHGSRLSLEFTRSWTHWGCTTWKNTLYASTKVLQHLSFAALQCRGLMRTSTARQLDRRRGGGAAGVLPAGSGSAQGRGGWRSGRAHPWQPFLGCSFGGPHPLSSFPTRTPNTHTVWHFSVLYALAPQSLSALLCRCTWLRMNADGLCGVALPFAVPAQTSVIVVWGGLRD